MLETIRKYARRLFGGLKKRNCTCLYGAKSWSIGMKRNSQMQKIKKLADEANGMDVVEALRILTESYLDYCGKSLSLRTVVYECAEMWLDRLVDQTDHPLSQIAKDDMYLFRFMPRICPDYDPDIYDDYDICCLGQEEFFSSLNMILDDEHKDFRLKQALCWGFCEMAERRLSWKA